MTNNIAVSITMGVADLTAKRAIMSAELKAANKDLNDFAKTARTSGMTDALKASMLEAAGSVAKARAEIRGIDGELTKLGAHGDGGLKAIFNVFDRSRLATLEEAGAKIPIFGSALADIGPAGIAAAAGFLAVGLAAEKAIKGAEWAEELKRTSGALGLTTTQLQVFDFVFQSMGIDIAKGRETLSGLAKTIGLVEEGAARKQQLEQFVNVLKITPDDLKGWGTLEQQIPHIVDALARMNPEERLGTESKLKIDPEVVQALIDERDRMRELIVEAHQYGVVISSDVIDKSAEAAGKMHEWKAIIDGELRSAFIELAPLIAGTVSHLADFARDIADVARGAHASATYIHDVATAIEYISSRVIQAVPLLGALSGVFGTSSEKAKEFGKFLDYVVHPLDAVIDALRTIGALKRAQAAAKPDPAPAPPPAPKTLIPPKVTGAPSIVETWTEQLHAVEVKSGEFFKDQTADELKFWQSKLALVKAGSKSWNEVQSKIYDASKSIARQTYEDQIAALNEQIAGDKDSWAAKKGDLDVRQAYIARTYGEQSSQYKAAKKEEEDAEREHQARLTEIARAADAQRIEALKANQQADAQIRRANAQTTEGQITEGAKYSGSPTAEITALQQVANLHRSLDQQELAEAQAIYAQEDALRQGDIAKALAAGGVESKGYIDAMAAKTKADQDFYNQHRTQEAQMAAAAAADQQKIAAGWHSMIDPLVQSWGSATKGLIKGTETWHQALVQFASGGIDMVVQALEKMAEKYIVSLLMGDAAQKTTSAGQVASYAGVAGAAGVASMAAAPFPMDLDAPAFGAAMSAAALSLGAFDKGMNIVPHDMIAQIHAGERIVPRADNDAMIGAMKGGGAGQGETHFHANFNPTIHTHQPPNMKQMLNEGASDMLAFMRTALRNGSLKLN